MKMRDVRAGGDIIGCTITEIVGSDPSPEILQQGADMLVDAEFNSKRVVRDQVKRRAIRAVVFGVASLTLWGAAALLTYSWLLRRGELRIFDLMRDFASVSVAAFVSVAITAMVAAVTTGLAVGQKNPTDAEVLNRERLRMAKIRWDELKALGLSKGDIKAAKKLKKKI